MTRGLAMVMAGGRELGNRSDAARSGEVARVRRAARMMTRRRRRAPLLLALAAGLAGVGWSYPTTRHVAWSAVDFFPPDLGRQVRRNHLRYDAGIRRGIQAPPAWRAGAPGVVSEALQVQAGMCAEGLRRPIPLEDLVEEMGVLAVRVLDANDPLAVIHGDPREAEYAGDFARYVDSVRGRLRLVYYGQNRGLMASGDVSLVIDRALARSGELYPFVGAEFYRTGRLRSWRTFDDRSVAFGVTAVALSRGMTDLANIATWVWRQGGGLVPTPIPTPRGHVGPTISPAPLSGGFPDRDRSRRGEPALPASTIVLPPP